MEVDTSIYKVSPARSVPSSSGGGGGLGLGKIAKGYVKGKWGDYQTKDVPEDQSQWDTDDYERMIKYKPETIQGMAAKDDYENLMHKKTSFDIMSKAEGRWTNMSSKDKAYVLKHAPDTAKQIVELEKNMESLQQEQLDTMDEVTSGMGAVTNMMSQAMSKTDDLQVRSQIYKEFTQRMIDQHGDAAGQLVDMINKVIPPDATGVHRWDDVRVGTLGSFGTMMMNFNTSPKAKKAKELSYSDKGKEGLASMIEKNTGDKLIGQQIRNGKSLKDLTIEEEVFNEDTGDTEKQRFIYVGGRKMTLGQFHQMMNGGGSGQEPPQMTNTPSMNQGQGEALPGGDDGSEWTPIKAFNNAVTGKQSAGVPPTASQPTMEGEPSGMPPTEEEATPDGEVQRMNTRFVYLAKQLKNKKLNSHDKRMVEGLINKYRKATGEKKKKILQQLAKRLAKG